MVATERLQTAVKHVLSEYAKIPYSLGGIKGMTAFDEATDNYILMSIGWMPARRIHGIIAHLQIIDGKVWIQRDGTEEGFALELERLGIPKSQMVLGFHPADVRPHTEYAVA